MVQINLSEFYNYTLPQLLEFITLQDEADYNITLPNKTVVHKDCNFNVFWEYYHASFVGQDLWQITTYFTYKVPCKRAQYFSFQVTIWSNILGRQALFFSQWTVC